MPIDAVALLHLPLSTVRTAFSETEEVEGGLQAQGPRGPVMVQAIDDAVHLHLGVPFDTPPRDVGVLVRQILGETADLHGDERGIYIYPDVARSQASTYDEVIDDLGEGGMWAPLATIEEADKAKTLGAGDAVDLFSAVQGMMGGDLLGQVQAALADPNGDAMKSLAGLAGQLLENPELRQTVQSAAQKMMAGGKMPEEIAGSTGGLLEQAKSIAGQMAADNPELIEDIAKKINAGEEE